MSIVRATQMAQHSAKLSGMRRHPSRLAGAPKHLVGAAVAVLTAGVILGPASAAFADPSGTPSTSASAGAGATEQLVGPPTPGEAGCAMPTALDQITGMVVTQAGIAVIEGHSDDPVQVKISILDAACKATVKTWTGPVNPVDPQDLTVGSDGSFWICDCGDTGLGNGDTPSRARIAVEKAPAGGGAASIYRYTYPSGSLNAQAMLLSKTDLPIIFAQESGGKTGIYTPAKLAPVDNDAQGEEEPLTRAGEFTPMKTNTANPKGPVGEAIVTGAAKSPDGKRVVIRTFSDAYEYIVGDDGDIVKAITTTKPNVTPLPGEPQGEAISYTADGAKFQTLSVMPDGATTTPKLLTYTRYIAPEVTEEPAPENNLGPTEEGGLLAKLNFNELTRIIAAVGVVGLVLAIAGIIGIRRARRRRREEDDYDDYDDYDDEPRRGRGRGRGRDDRGYSGLREPSYSGGYDDQGGYGAGNSYGGGYNGYGGQGGGYADAGYGQASGAGYGGQQDFGGYGQQPGYGDYGAQPGYGDYGGQQGYGEYGGGQQQYGGGGYGYEEDFDPMQDPRRH
jgi:hypothetical protein